MDHPVLVVVMRYLHIVSAIAAVGGMAFILACLTPAVRLLDDRLRESVMQLAHHRFVRLVWLAIAGLIVSGTFGWIRHFQAYRDLGPRGNILIGTKVLLAIIIFAIVFLRSIGVIKPTSQRAVLMVNIHLAAIVIVLGSILYYLRTTL